MLTAEQKVLDDQCRRRGLSDDVRSRVVRLNPNYHQAAHVKGWHPRETAKMACLMHDLVSKRDFVRKHGRVAWDVLPNGMKWRSGKRRYIDRKAYLDNIWQIWAGLIPPCEVMAWYPSKRYANDPACTVEYITREEFSKRLMVA